MELTLTRSGNQATLRYGGFSRSYLPIDDVKLKKIVVENTTKPETILSLGRQLFEWLSGNAHWLKSVPNELIITAPVDSAVWRAPWEILADEKGHLAARELSVLRRSPDAPSNPRTVQGTDDFRLGVLFMATAPEGQFPLRFEDEEAAILRAIREPNAVLGVPDPNRIQPIDMDLFGEDTGNLAELSKRLDLLQDHRIDVLHLSGHAVAGSPPTFAMETPEGALDAVPADKLSRELRYHLPQLPVVFLSACETGRLGLSESMAETLIQRGANSVLAWSGKVFDTDATAFAAWFYHHLGRGRDLTYAVAEARRELCVSRRPHWHLARLFVGQQAPTRVAKPSGRSRPINNARDPYSMAHTSGRPRPVCSQVAFVGRRRVIQRALTKLRSGQHRGIVLTGVGQQGKSSLAVRLGDRLSDQLTTVLTYGKLDAHRLHAQLAEHFGEPDNPNRPVDHSDGANRLRQSLEKWLRLDDKPTLLILDDFEQNLDQQATPVRPLSDRWEIVTTILNAFANAPHTRSRLVITSRYAFECQDAIGRPLHEIVTVIPLPEMDPPERSRLRSNQISWSLRQGAEKSGRGNPGVTEALLRLAEEDQELFLRTCEKLDALQAPDGKIGEIIANIAMEALIESARRTPGADLLLRIGLFLDLPVPASIFDQVARAFDCKDPMEAQKRLRALGLLEERGSNRLALNTLAAAWLDPISEAERIQIGKQVLAVIRTEDLENDLGLALQAFLVAAPAGDIEVLKQTANSALLDLETLDDPKRTTPLAIAACRQLIAAGAEVNGRTILAAIDQGFDSDELPADLLAAAEKLIKPEERSLQANLLLREGRVLDRRGEPDKALESLRRAEAAFKEIDDDYSQAVTLGYIARILVKKGEVDKALRMHQEMLTVFERFSDAREHAVTLGDITRILVKKGEVDEALRMHQEMLTVFERLGHVRERAVTLGSIAQILVSKGQVDEALRMHQEEVAVYERIGDARERAVSQGGIARILVSKGQVDEALRMYQEMLTVFEQLGDPSARAVTQSDIAEIIAKKGEVDEALRMYQEILTVFERLGDPSAHAVTLGSIARILVAKGEVDEALRMHQEMLSVFERLGDARSRAVTLGDIARIMASKGKVDEALRMHQEEIAVYERLGDARERAVTLGEVARILVSRGEVDDALRMHWEQITVYERMGYVREHAVTLGDVARILVSKGEVDDALRMHQERLTVFERLGDASARAVTLGDIAQILAAKGEVDEALRMHQERLTVFERMGDARERAVTLGDIARILVAKGEVDEALRMHQEMLSVFERLGDVRSRAVTLGGIARILVSKGKVDEALRMHQEEIAVYERLSDARSRAVTLGDIARILVDKGEVDEAIKLQTERLNVNRGLNDADGIAAAQFDIAKLEATRGNLVSAIPRLREAHEILIRIGRVDGIAVVGLTYGMMLDSVRKSEEAFNVLNSCRQCFVKLGKLEECRKIDLVLSKIANCNSS
jgi:tetratricopeptide (TPR) repeat protein